MRNLNYIRLFEEYESEDDYISEEDIIFSLTEEDIKDFFLPITDKGFKINVSKCYVDDNYEKVVYQKEIKSAIVRNRLRGSYNIHISREIGDDDKSSPRLTYSSEDVVIFKFLMDEILQISKRVELIEWEPSPSARDGAVIDIFIVCNKTDNKKNKRKFLNDEYKSELNSLIYRKIEFIKGRIMEELTKSFKNAIIYRQWKNNHLYFFCKPVTKAVLNSNMKKLDKLISSWSKINSIEIKELEELKKENPNIDIPEKTSFIIDVELDYDSIVRISKKQSKDNFIYRRNQG